MIYRELYLKLKYCSSYYLFQVKVMIDIESKIRCLLSLYICLRLLQLHISIILYIYISIKYKSV